MKYLKSFNESRSSHKLQESDIQEILDIFTEIVDEGFLLINKDEDPDDQLQFYNPAEGEITYQLSTNFLDDKGKDEYSSKYFDSIRGSWNYTDDKWKIQNKHFDYYQQIIFNVNIGSKDSIKDVCSSIYDRLISSGYNCQLWEPRYNKFRFHISTPESNPFLDSKNSLKSE
jgi:hypothetical protein